MNFKELNFTFFGFGEINTVMKNGVEKKATIK